MPRDVAPRRVILLLVAGVATLFGALPATGGCGGNDESRATSDGGLADAATSRSDAASSEAAAPDAAGADAAPDCSRRAQVRNASPSLYDALVVDLAALSDASARAERVARFVDDVRAAGGAPLESPDDDRVVFLAYGVPPGGTWNVGGSFRPAQPDWKANPLPLTQVAGTDLWVGETHVPHGSPASYKLLTGATDDGFREDPLAMNVAWDGLDRAAPGEFNAVVHAADADPTRGRLVAYRGVHSTKLGDVRDVFVYLPARYDDGTCAPLPHLIVHDGNESLTRGDFAGVADATYANDPASAAVLAFVALASQDVRIDEYTFHTATALGDAYGDFLADEIEPMLASRYRLCGAPEDRGLTGASLGGLISTYLAFGRPTLWGYVGAQSASLFWDSNAMITRAAHDPKVPVRFYLDHGCPDDNCDENRLMAQALTQKSYEVDHVEVADAAHAWSYWHDRFGLLLGYFRQGRPACK